MATWTETSPDIPYAPGTRMRLWFHTIGITYVTAAQIALAERELEKEKNFTVLSHSIPKAEGFLKEFYFEVEIKKEDAPDPELQLAGVSGGQIMAVIIIALGVAFLWVAKGIVEIQVDVTEAVGEAAEKSEGAIKATGWTALQIAAAIGGLYVLWKNL